MKKATKLALFVVLATLFNILCVCGVFLALVLVFTITVSKLLPDTVKIWAVAAFLLLSLVLTALIYRKAISFLRKKYRLDEFLDLMGKK